jgi:hypothetical protein
VRQRTNGIGLAAGPMTIALMWLTLSEETAGFVHPHMKLQPNVPEDPPPDHVTDFDTADRANHEICRDVVEEREGGRVQDRPRQVRCRGTGELMAREKFGMHMQIRLEMACRPRPKAESAKLVNGQIVRTTLPRR